MHRTDILQSLSPPFNTGWPTSHLWSTHDRTGRDTAHQPLKKKNNSMQCALLVTVKRTWWSQTIHFCARWAEYSNWSTVIKYSLVSWVFKLKYCDKIQLRSTLGHRNQYSDQTAGWMAWESLFDARQGQEFCPAPRLSQGTNWPPADKYCEPLARARIG
jgi:hypothetical protein